MKIKEKKLILSVVSKIDQLKEASFSNRLWKDRN